MRRIAMRRIAMVVLVLVFVAAIAMVVVSSLWQAPWEVVEPTPTPTLTPKPTVTPKPMATPTPIPIAKVTTAPILQPTLMPTRAPEATKAPPPTSTPSPTPRPNYLAVEVESLTERVVKNDWPWEWRSGEKSVSCANGASYRSALQAWLVSCTFYQDDAGTKVTRTTFYQFDDVKGTIR